MAATVFMSESNGAGEVVTDNISNLNMGSVDQANLIAASHPLVIPSVALSPRSGYSKFVRIKLDALGGSTQIENLRFWKSAGAYVTGESIKANCDENAGVGRFTRATYHTPFTYVSGGFPTYAALNVATVIPGTANVSIDANGVADDGTGDTVSGQLTVAGTYSQYIVLFLQISNTTPAGAVNQKTFTIQYDES